MPKAAVGIEPDKRLKQLIRDRKALEVVLQDLSTAISKVSVRLAGIRDEVNLLQAPPHLEAAQVPCLRGGRL